jgi:CrcB protein
MERLLWICLGGAVGSGARYLLSGWMISMLGTSFPHGTLAVNVLGSLVIGAFLHVGVSVEMYSPTLRLALTTGVLGGFTTFSSFSYETVQLVERGAWLLAGVNVTVTVVGCLFATAVGFLAARWIFGS